MRLVTALDDAVRRDGAGQGLLGFVVDDRPYTFREAIRALGGWEQARTVAGADLTSPEVLDDIHALLDAGPQAWQGAARLVERFTAAVRGRQAQARPAGQLLAPIPRPRKNVFCVGRNYVEHAKERGAQAPEHPVFFTKPPTSVVGPDAQVPYPPQTEQFDYEGELAVVIGRKGRDIPRSEAMQYVFGYTILNDLTARDLQKRHQQWFKGKSLDGSCPMGPTLVTADEVGDPHKLQLETRVNGELRQSASTELMIFDIPELIAVLSLGMTLEPGDIIATGTPAGVGAATGKLLKPGDRVDITISGLGTLTTYIV